MKVLENYIWIIFASFNDELHLDVSNTEKKKSWTFIVNSAFARKSWHIEIDGYIYYHN
jgi:hypothetical protein